MAYPTEQVKEFKALIFAIELTTKQLKDITDDLNTTEVKLLEYAASSHKLSSNELQTYEQKLGDLQVIVPAMSANLDKLKTKYDDFMKDHVHWWQVRVNHVKRGWRHTIFMNSLGIGTTEVACVVCGLRK